MESYNHAPPSYYSVLGVATDSSDEDIKRAYRRLAMLLRALILQQWHPDKWTRTPSVLGEAKKRFQQIQEAYSVLSDKRKRMMYDAGLYDEDNDEVDGFADFLQEMASLMEDERKEEKIYSVEELQGMFLDLAQSFQANNSYDAFYDHLRPQQSFNLYYSSTSGGCVRDSNKACERRVDNLCR